ncbi:MAG: ketoacyl-ACP synthase III [Bradymonadaceae bacterium]|nr:ketoacyl-ACP synthase III [Lujinxingiaceae bacterium]
MSQSFAVRIAGIGRYLPARVVTNDEVEELCLLSPGDIAQTGAGVVTRHWANRDETNSMMGAAAAREAIEDAGLALEDIDLILNASGTQEQVIPDGAPLIQRELGLGSSGIACMSVHTTCLGFYSALDISASFLATGRYHKILIVNSDITSVGLNCNQPSSAMLFGDGAAAVVVTACEPGQSSCIEALHFETYGVGAHLTEIRGGGTRRHPNLPETKKRDNLFSMDGEGVYLLAREYFGRFMQTFQPGLIPDGIDTIDWFVPHQASMAALKMLERMGVPRSKMVVTVDRYGNTVSSSTPIALYEAIRDGRIQRGQRLLLAGTAAGLSLGAVILRY